MEAELAFPSFSDDLFGEPAALSPRACGSCQRPASTCLCDVLPNEPLATKTRVVILQHPMEAAKRLSTVPLIPQAIKQTQIFLGRRFRLRSCPALQAALSGAEVTPLELQHQHKLGGPEKCASDTSANQPMAQQSSDTVQAEEFCMGHDCSGASMGNKCPGLERERLVLLLFPGPEAKDLSRLAVEVPGFETLEKTLVVIDGTWQHAREMFRSLHPCLPASVVQVCLPPNRRDPHGDLVTCPGGLIMRKEPEAGFVSTSEAVARALFFCEPDGARVRDAIIAPLKRMVALQAARNPAMAAKQALFEKG